MSSQSLTSSTTGLRANTRQHGDSAAGDRLGASLASVGRWLYALPFAAFGLLHFTGAEAMAGMVPLPGGVFWVYFTGVALIAAAVGIITGVLGRYAGLGLALLMATFVLGVHLPGLADPQSQQFSMIALLKDIALAGAALTFASRLPLRRSTN